MELAEINTGDLLNVTHTIVIEDETLLKLSAAYLITGLLIVLIGTLIKNN